MITLGVDAHKGMHVAVALDERGQEQGQWRGPNSQSGWEALYLWACKLGELRQWGIEGAWNYGRGFAQYLLTKPEIVSEINPAWTARERRKARHRGKSDPLDAHAVACLVQRETHTLPQVTAEDETAVLDLLVRQRDDVLSEATRIRNQIQQMLLQLDPQYRSRLPHLQTKAGLAALEQYPLPLAPGLAYQRAQAVRRLAQRLRLIVAQAADLAEEIRHQAQECVAPLTQLCGVKLLTAAALAGILGPGRRFANEAHLAAYAGGAPLQASSAERVRHRLNPGGKRRLNAILYRIALTQARHSPQARAYLDRRVPEGKTRREALRALKRSLIRAIWRLWQQCQLSSPQQGILATAARTAS